MLGDENPSDMETKHFIQREMHECFKRGGWLLGSHNGLEPVALRQRKQIKNIVLDWRHVEYVVKIHYGTNRQPEFKSTPRRSEPWILRDVETYAAQMGLSMLDEITYSQCAEVLTVGTSSQGNGLGDRWSRRVQHSEARWRTDQFEGAHRTSNGERMTLMTPCGIGRYRFLWWSSRSRGAWTHHAVLKSFSTLFSVSVDPLVFYHLGQNNYSFDALQTNCFGINIKL